MLIGVFSSLKKMKYIVNTLIKDNYEKNGSHGWYHFRYAKVELDEPWFGPAGKDLMDEGRAILSFNTMHPEYFKHCIINDPNTGEVINWDSPTEH